ncbi:MAG: hypothetical protein GY756_17005 [bacterium]|nr:hypothetical protein [bacterium]
MKTFLITFSVLFMYCNFLNATTDHDKLKELRIQKKEMEKTLNPMALLLLRTLYIHKEQKIYYLNENSQIPKDNVLVKFIDDLYVVADKPENRGIVVARRIVRNKKSKIRQQNLYIDIDLKDKKYSPGSKINIDKVLIVTNIKPDDYKNIPNVDHSLYPIDEYLIYIELCNKIISMKKTDFSSQVDNITE